LKNNKRQKRDDEGVVPVVESLPTKCKALSSNSSIAKKSSKIQVYLKKMLSLIAKNRTFIQLIL
jgi:hypothetical protein